MLNIGRANERKGFVLLLKHESTHEKQNRKYSAKTIQEKECRTNRMGETERLRERERESSIDDMKIVKAFLSATFYICLYVCACFFL
jgi:hypothetical protein